ncbi:MAG: transcription elongation factor GreA [Lachnospiraceae bacterium]|nr:transcription elongation factor GreA [Lachnospiraceae bacterium]
MDKKLLTHSGLAKLEDELNDLKIRQRKEIAQKIKEAREQGDLSENAEYDAAKEEQRHIEARIAELEAILKNVEVIDETEMDLDSVNVGCSVTVHNETLNRDMVYHMVGSTEASSLLGRISNESPVGHALMGRKVGETVTVEVPAGEMKLRILNIQRA